MSIRNKIILAGVSAALIGSIAVNDKLVRDVTLWEGTKYTAYYDVGGIPTVCQGYTGKEVVFGKKYTAEECNALLRSALKTHAEGMLNCVKVDLTQNEFNAYAMFTYNVGVGAFCKSSLLKKLNNNDRIGACNGLLAWSYAGGKYVQGLNNRRQYERNLCLSDYRGSAVSFSYRMALLG